MLVVIEGIWYGRRFSPICCHVLSSWGAPRVPDGRGAFFGVMGRSGMGIAEHYGFGGDGCRYLDGHAEQVLASCGGYIAGESALVEHLVCRARLSLQRRYRTIGSGRQHWRHCICCATNRARRNSGTRAAVSRPGKQAGINTGRSAGLSVVPAITGSSIKAAFAADALYHRGINVQPILYPAVEEQAARLRFFMSCSHTEEDIRDTVEVLAAEWANL